MTLNYTIAIPKNLIINFSVPSIAPSSFTTGTSSRIATSSIPISTMRTAIAQPFGFESLCRHFNECINKIYFFFHSFFSPKVNFTASQSELANTYFGLGEQKWRECIDGLHHDKGKFVYDKGLHGGTIEPGYIASMEDAFQFVANSLNRKVDATWYLQLHKRTCRHFNGDPSIFLMGQERVGVFRKSGVAATFSGVYQVTAEALTEFNALDRGLKQVFGDAYGLGAFTDCGPGKKYLLYKSMTEEQVTKLFNYFLNNFYNEVENASTPEAKLWAIAKLHQRLEWLHPVLDGTSRTSTALMNKNLTDYGFHPALLEYPHLSSSYGLKQWFEYLKKGLQKWEQQKSSISQ